MSLSRTQLVSGTIVALIAAGTPAYQGVAYVANWVSDVNASMERWVEYDNLWKDEIELRKAREFCLRDGSAHPDICAR